MQSPAFPVTSSLLGPNILLNTIFSNTLSFLSSFNVSDHVSHPYITTGTIIVLGTFTPRNFMWHQMYEYVSMRPLNFIARNF